MSDQEPFEGTREEPKQLRNLRLLVNLLTITMILGMVVIVVIIVMRFGSVFTVTEDDLTASFTDPERIVLPEGETALGYTKTDDWYAVVTTDAGGQQRIRIFAENGAEMQVIDVIPAEAR